MSPRQGVGSLGREFIEFLWLVASPRRFSNTCQLCGVLGPSRVPTAMQFRHLRLHLRGLAGQLHVGDAQTDSV